MLTFFTTSSRLSPAETIKSLTRSTTSSLRLPATDNKSLNFPNTVDFTSSVDFTAELAPPAAKSKAAPLTVTNKAPIPDKACLALAIYSLSELAIALPATPATAAAATPSTTFFKEPRLANVSPLNNSLKLRRLRPKKSSLLTPASAKKSLPSSPNGLFFIGESMSALIVVLL